MNLYLAIDNGGTKADYLLADDTRELARARSGTLKRLRADAATAAASLDAGLAQLSALSGVSMGEVTCTCVGTAGITVPLVADWLREALAARVSGELLLVGDVEIALDAAFPGAPGVLVLAGTGSNVAGRGARGKDAAAVIQTAGGWGPVLGDQGSGYGIGLRALRSMVDALDLGHETTLLPAVLSAWQLDSLDEFVEMANRSPTPDFSQLVALVLRCAEQGDAVAADVLQRSGEALAARVLTVIRRLQRDDADLLPPLAFAGSILEKVAPVRNALIAEVRRDFPAIAVRDGVIDPLDGALWRARHFGGSLSHT